MVRYDGLLNPFHRLNLSRLTHPTRPTQLKLCIRRVGEWGSKGERLLLGFFPQPNLHLFNVFQSTTNLLPYFQVKN